MMSSFENIDDSTFDQQVLKSSLPVIVEFGAEWCGPCKQMEPLLEQISNTEWKGKVRLVRMDVDQCVNTTMMFQVMSVPTLILFVQGEARQRLSGKQPRNRLVEKFTSFLS